VTEPTQELLDAARMELPTPAANEHCVFGPKITPADETTAKGTTSLPADWDDALATALSHDTAPALNEVDVADSKTGSLAQAQARVEQQ
jgi:hypothetical protein